MRRVLQLINWLIIIWVLNEAILLVASEGAGFDISVALFFGSCVWLLAPAFTLVAIHSSAGGPPQWVGYFANVVTALWIVAVFADMGSAAYAILALFVTPLGLNLWGIWKLSGARPSKLELVEPREVG